MMLSAASLSITLSTATDHLILNELIASLTFTDLATNNPEFANRVTEQAFNAFCGLVTDAYKNVGLLNNNNEVNPDSQLLAAGAQ